MTPARGPFALLALVALACDPGAGTRDPAGRDSDAAGPDTSVDTSPVDTAPVDTGTPVDADGDGALARDDCDDADPAVYPGAVELCGNGIDDDCDGGAGPCRHEGVTLSSEAGSTSTHDAAVSGEALPAGDLDGDGIADLAMTNAAEMWSTLEDADQTGLVRLFLGGAPLPATFDGAWATVEGGDGAKWVGASLTADHDADGDGLGDLWVMAYQESDGMPQGMYHLGSVSAGVNPLAGADDWYQGSDGYDWSVSGLPAQLADLDGDGQLDTCLAMSHVLSRSPGVIEYHLPWYAGSPPGAHDETDATGTVDMGGAGVRAFVAGDLDGDGIGDLALSRDADGDDAWDVQVFLGPFSGTRGGDTADTTLLVEGRTAGAGYRLVLAGDLDGDGIGDLGTDDIDAEVDGMRSAGTAYFTREIPAGTAALVDHATVVTGTAENQWVGTCITGLGDLDGDGAGDVMVGCPGCDRQVETSPHQSPGRAAVFYGNLAAALTIDDVEWAMAGTRQLDDLGHTCGPAGDFTGDGAPDVALLSNGVVSDYYDYMFAALYRFDGSGM